MKQHYNHLNILMLPTDACNMNCVYCFHKPYQTCSNRMSLEVVKHVIDITVPYYKQINFIWHGGEPLLMGLDFYKHVLDIQKNVDCEINNSIQSNLTLLTPELADFISSNNFSISGSYDGVCNENLRGHSEEILKGRSLMLERNRRCGLIMVVSGVNINHLIESYHFFKGLETNFTLNLYLDQNLGAKEYLRLDKDVAVTKLCELFDYWLKDRDGNIHISYFRHILDFILEKKKSVCTFTSCLGRWMGIHYDGTIGPCNRYFPEKYSFGNVNDYTDIRESFNSAGFFNLLKEAVERREKCKSCLIYDFCSGGCNNTALNEHGINNNDGLNCYILKAVYEHIVNVVDVLDYDNKFAYNPVFVKMIEKINIKNTTVDPLTDKIKEEFRNGERDKNPSPKSDIITDTLRKNNGKIKL